MISILGDRTANVNITWYHWPCNIDTTKNRFYMAARIDKDHNIGISCNRTTEFSRIPNLLI